MQDPVPSLGICSCPVPGPAVCSPHPLPVEVLLNHDGEGHGAGQGLSLIAACCKMTTAPAPRPGKQKLVGFQCGAAALALIALPWALQALLAAGGSGALLHLPAPHPVP